MENFIELQKGGDVVTVEFDNYGKLLGLYFGGAGQTESPTDPNQHIIGYWDRLPEGGYRCQNCDLVSAFEDFISEGFQLVDSDDEEYLELVKAYNNVTNSY